MLKAITNTRMYIYIQNKNERSTWDVRVHQSEEQILAVWGINMVQIPSTVWGIDMVRIPSTIMTFSQLKP